MELKSIKRKRLFKKVNYHKYLIDLIYAFEDVDVKHQSWSYDFLNDDNNIQNNERPFCYELYHQLRLKTKEEKNIILHGEINKNGIKQRKKFIVRLEKMDRWSEIEERLPNSFIPDLVLHEGQNINHPDSHHLYIEVKSKPSVLDNGTESYLKDLLKCLFAIQAMGYSYGVFICLNINKVTQFKNKINEILRYNHGLFATFSRGLKKLVILYRSKEKDGEIEFYQIENNNNQ